MFTLHCQGRWQYMSWWHKRKHASFCTSMSFKMLRAMQCYIIPACVQFTSQSQLFIRQTSTLEMLLLHIWFISQQQCYHLARIMLIQVVSKCCYSSPLNKIEWIITSTLVFLASHSIALHGSSWHASWIPKLCLVWPDSKWNFSPKALIQDQGHLNQNPSQRNQSWNWKLKTSECFCYGRWIRLK